MKHISIIKMKLDFPFIYAEYENGKKYKYDINDAINTIRRYKQLGDVDFFNKAKLGIDGYCIIWSDEVDLLSTNIRDYGEEVEEF